MVDIARLVLMREYLLTTIFVLHACYVAREMTKADRIHQL